MSLTPLKVVVTRKLPDAVEKRMSELFDVKLRHSLDPMSKAELLAAISEANVLVSSLEDKITQQILAQANGNLKLIANYGAGFDHINIKIALNPHITLS